MLPRQPFRRFSQPVSGTHFEILLAQAPAGLGFTGAQSTAPRQDSSATLTNTVPSDNILLVSVALLYYRKKAKFFASMVDCSRHIGSFIVESGEIMPRNYRSI